MSNAPRAAEAHRDWGSDDSRATVMHVDMDAFFASVEVARRPALAGKPVVVGDGERSVVLAATYEARALGVKSAMPVSRAKLLAPQAIYLRPDHKAYYEVSRGVMEVLHAITPEVEQVSVDEAFLEVAGARRRLGGPVAIGHALRARVHRDFGVTCSVGIGPNKFVAKLASTNCKPDGLMLVPHDRAVEFVQCLPVGALWGVGEKTRERLLNWGIETVEQLARTDHDILARMLGPTQASHLLNLAWARDARSVTSERVEKSIGAERTFDKDTADPRVLAQTMMALSDDCGSRLRAREFVARTVSIKVRNSQFQTVTRSHTLASPTNGTKEIFDSSMELLRSLKIAHPVRLLGVRTENLIEEQSGAFQDTLLESVSGAGVAVSKSDKVIDAIRAKFGQDAIERAVQGGVRLSRVK